MTFGQIQGNDEVKRALAGMVDSGKIPHAIMFHEDDGGAAVSLALAFLQYLYCKSRSGGDSCSECPSCNRISKMIHPDVHFIFPVISSELSLDYYAQWRTLVLEHPEFTENDLHEALGIEGKLTMIGVREARALLEKLNLSALEGGYRSVVIYLPEKMNQEAANRLLKLIEEPPLMTQFLLVTHSPEKVMQTISSRCQHIRVMPCSAVKPSAVKFGEFDAMMDALVRKDLVSALDIADQFSSGLSRESARAFCKFAADRFRSIFLVQQGMGDLAADREAVAGWAALLRKTFPRSASASVDRAAALIDRNVNLKILFTDFVGRLYRAI